MPIRVFIYVPTQFVNDDDVLLQFLTESLRKIKKVPRGTILGPVVNKFREGNGVIRIKCNYECTLHRYMQEQVPGGLACIKLTATLWRMY